MAPRDMTPGDGNCFFHAIMDQISLLGIQNAPPCHQTLRQAVCQYLANLPEGMNDYVEELYGEEGIEKLIEKFSKDGEWVEQEMIQATAYFLNRNIVIYSPDGQTLSQTKMQGGEGADELESLSIFYHSYHYQSIYQKE